MPRPINITEKISGVVGLPAPLYAMADHIVTASNPRLQQVVDLINKSQNVFDRIKPLMPPQNGIRASDWDAVALDRWGAIPTGGVVAAIQVAAIAGRAMVQAYATALQPALRPRLFQVDQESGIVPDARALVLLTSDVDHIRAQVTAFRDAIEDISEI